MPFINIYLDIVKLNEWPFPFYIKGTFFWHIHRTQHMYKQYIKVFSPEVDCLGWPNPKVYS